MLTGREIGWKVPINDVAGLASLVEKLSTDRAGLAQYSRNSLEFARDNLFEKIFEMRMSHCSRIYRQSII
jgi:hypothetical protein